MVSPPLRKSSPLLPQQAESQGQFVRVALSALVAVRPRSYPSIEAFADCPAYMQRSPRKRISGPYAVEGEASSRCRDCASIAPRVLCPGHGVSSRPQNPICASSLALWGSSYARLCAIHHFTAKRVTHAPQLFQKPFYGGRLLHARDGHTLYIRSTELLANYSSSFLSQQIRNHGARTSQLITRKQTTTSTNQMRSIGPAG